jgi:hypothetical protein
MRKSTSKARTAASVGASIGASLGGKGGPVGAGIGAGFGGAIGYIAGSLTPACPGSQLLPDGGRAPAEGTDRDRARSHRPRSVSIPVEDG